MGLVVVCICFSDYISAFKNIFDVPVASSVNTSFNLSSSVEFCCLIFISSILNAASYQNTQEILNHSDPNNTTVGNLDFE